MKFLICKIDYSLMTRTLESRMWNVDSFSKYQVGKSSNCPGQKQIIMTTWTRRLEMPGMKFENSILISQSCSQDTCNQWILLCEDYFSTNMATRAWLSLDATDLSFSTNGGGGWGLGGYHQPGMWVLLSFKRHHRACLNNPSFSNLGLCAACWALFMCLHELWPTSVSHLSSFLNIALGLAGEL